MYTKLVKYIYCKYLIQKISVQTDYEQYLKTIWDWIPIVSWFAKKTYKKMEFS